MGLVGIAYRNGLRNKALTLEEELSVCELELGCNIHMYTCIYNKGIVNTLMRRSVSLSQGIYYSSECLLSVQQRPCTTLVICSTEWTVVLLICYK